MRPGAIAAAVGLCTAVACAQSPSVSDSAPAGERAVELPSAGTEASAQTESEGELCKEHGVLEAVCTACNPALAAVFRAKGDWCLEHGFPKSFCPACHPEKGGRPDADVQRESAPADGTKVSFKTKEISHWAGIRVVKAMLRQEKPEITVTARIVCDAAKVAEVNPRVPGVLRSVLADVGTRVSSGTPLATVASAELAGHQASLRTARALVQLTSANYARQKQLQKEGVAPEKESWEARQQWLAAKADLAAAAAATAMVEGGDGGAVYTLTAPIAGVVTVRNAVMGSVVDSGKVLFEIVDTSSMWAEVEIPEGSVAQVAEGQAVELDVEGLSNTTFRGVLTYLAPQIDVLTRTAKGRVALENSAGLLRANQFARARVRLANRADRILIPRNALQRVRDEALVFVRLAEDEFEVRRVKVGAGDDQQVEVTGGIKAGDAVVTEGSFLLKTETLKDSIGAGCCEAGEKK